MTPEDAARIQSSQAQHGQDTGKGSFSSRAQSAGDRNASSASSGKSGGGSKNNKGR